MAVPSVNPKKTVYSVHVQSRKGQSGTLLLGRTNDGSSAVLLGFLSAGYLEKAGTMFVAPSPSDWMKHGFRVSDLSSF